MEGLVKSLGLIAKVEDVSERTVSAYWSNFGNEDFDGDIIVKGAYKKTITDRSNENPVLFLKNHNFNNHISTAHELIEDSKGLLARYKLPKTTQGNDALEMYKAGFYNQHSVGFKSIQQEKENGVNYIKEIKLFEGSVVPFGANPLTPMVSITKTFKFHYDTVPNSLQEEYDNAMNLMKSWKGSDEAFLEIQVKALLLESYMKESALTTITPTIEPAVQPITTRERIELKGIDWTTYESFTDEQKECVDLCQSLEYKIKEVAAACGIAQLNPIAKIHAEVILTYAIEQIAYLESVEKGMMTGDNSQENNLMPEMKSITDPSGDSQPSEETALELFIKSLNTSK